MKTVVFMVTENKVKSYDHDKLIASVGMGGLCGYSPDKPLV